MTITLYPVVGLDRLVDGDNGSNANVVTLPLFQRVPKPTIVIYPLDTDQTTAKTFTGKTVRVAIGDAAGIVMAQADCACDPSGFYTCELNLNTAEMVTALLDRTFAKLRFEIQAISTTDINDREPILLCDCFVYPNVIVPGTTPPSAVLIGGTPVWNPDTQTFYTLRVRGTGDQVSVEIAQ